MLYVFFFLNEEVVVFFLSVTQVDSSLLVRELERIPRCFSLVLETVFSVLNLIDYLHFRVPEVGLEKLFEMFGPSLQVTY